MASVRASPKAIEFFFFFSRSLSMDRPMTTRCLTVGQVAPTPSSRPAVCLSLPAHVSLLTHLPNRPPWCKRSFSTSKHDQNRGFTCANPKLWSRIPVRNPLPPPFPHHPPGRARSRTSAFNPRRAPAATFLSLSLSFPRLSPTGLFWKMSHHAGEVRW